MNKHTVAHNFVMAALKGAAKHHVKEEDLLVEAGISLDVLTNKNYPVTAEQYACLIKTLWLTTKDENMGLGSIVSPLGSFSMMSRAVIHCNNLAHAFKRAGQFYSLFYDDMSQKIGFERSQQQESLARLEFKLTLADDPDRFLHESTLVIWHRFASWLIDRRISLKEVRLVYQPPEHEKLYWQLFACPVVFEAEHNALVFDEKFLQMPIMQTEAALKEFLKVSPANLLARPEERNTMTATIRSLLGRDFSNDFPEFDWLAEQVHLAPQSLRRKLREEGTSFQEIKDQLRRDTAIGLLDRNDLSIQQIADRMGFSEASTFHRAFKKWTGVTPGDYKKGSVMA